MGSVEDGTRPKACSIRLLNIIIGEHFSTNADPACITST